VKFTGDTILRAMRAYSCIDRHGRWTEIPTQVNISTFRDPGPAPSPAPYPENDSDVIDIEPEQLEEDLEEDEEEYDEEDSEPDDPEGDEPEATREGDDELEEVEDHVLDEHAPACAALPAQATQSAQQAESQKSLPQSSTGRDETTTACADSPAQAMPRNTVRGHNLQSRSEPDRTTCAAPSAQDSAHAAPQPRAAQYSNPASRSESTACADSPAQAMPRNAVRGHNPQSCSVSEHTACAALPAQTASHAHAWQNPLPPPAPLTDYPPVYPIYGPAIKNHRKTRCSSSLRFSNRR
jgi:hypothetical protein